MVNKLDIFLVLEVYARVIHFHRFFFVSQRRFLAALLREPRLLMSCTGKQFKDNPVLKVDICKVFDTLEWSFFLKVLRQVGFSDIFCSLIDIILHSAKLYVFVNGK
jgi:hypothetical protein